MGRAAPGPTRTGAGAAAAARRRWATGAGRGAGNRAGTRDSRRPADRRGRDRWLVRRAVERIEQRRQAPAAPSAGGATRRAAPLPADRLRLDVVPGTLWTGRLPGR